MKGHEFVIACKLASSPPRAVFVEFDGQPDPHPDYPVVVAKPYERDYRWAYGLVVHVTGIDSEAVFEAVEALKRFKARRIFAHYLETPTPLLWDSEVDA
jgi:hypothetical protein